MVQLIPNSFSSYNLSTEEEETGSVLNYLQKAVLQNKLAIIAQDKLNTVFDPLNPTAFAQQEAYLRGQMEVINWLLDSSLQLEELAAAKLAEEVRQQQESQH